VAVTVENRLATVRIDREHGNAVNDDLLQGLMTVYNEAIADPGVRGILLTSTGKLFSPGLDLRELREFDRRQMHRFMSRFSACLIVMYTCPKPVVAALGGHALAGGCVLALTAESRILREGALIGLNEVRVGVPLPFGVTTILREEARTPWAEEVALLGSNYGGAEAVRVGLAHEILPEEGFEEACLERLAEYAGRDPRAYATTKRYLRSGAVERIRANDAMLVEQFLDCWFSDETRRRIEEIIASLDSRED
jgi:enoyl-CoA hydratase/carnithine racemase